MEWVETTGSDLDQAKERALDQLGVDVSDAEFEVVAEAKAGIFGFGRSEARVRARVKPRQPRARAENRRKRGQGNRRGGKRGQTSQGGRSQADGKADKTGKSGQSKGQSSKRQQPKGEGKQGQSKSQPKQKKSGNGRRGRGADQGRDGDARQSSERTNKQGKEKEPVVTERMDVEEQSEVATEFVQGLVDGFGVDGSASVDVDGETLTVNVAGDGLGLLIGPQGATLRAVEELTRTVLQRRADGRKYHRIRVDVGGYKQRRREALEGFTRELAEQVRDDGVARALEPMPAPDRKVVHDTVIEIDGVDTLSEGEDPRRRVVLVPAAGD